MLKCDRNALRYLDYDRILKFDRTIADPRRPRRRSDPVSHLGSEYVGVNSAEPLPLSENVACLNS